MLLFPFPVLAKDYVEAVSTDDSLQDKSEILLARDRGYKNWEERFVFKRLILNELIGVLMSGEDIMKN